MSASFRLSAAKYLITWPQCGIQGIEETLNHLKTIESIKYAVVCQESHATEGRHLHCFIWFLRRLNKRTNVFTYMGNVANVEVVGNSKRDIQNCIQYVKKDGVFIEYGKLPDTDKKEKRKEKTKFALTHDIMECIETGDYSISELCKLPMLKNISKSKRNRNLIRNVFWFYGETGSGKTQRAVEMMYEKYGDDYWISSGEIKNFKNGYCGEKGAILDDLRQGDIKFNDLLRMLDRYRYTVNVKGSTVEWLADDIIITSPFHPMELFKKYNPKNETWEPREDMEQLLRRINHIREFPQDDEITELVL